VVEHDTTYPRVKNKVISKNSDFGILISFSFFVLL
jgi:hypothetical protein